MKKFIFILILLFSVSSTIVFYNINHFSENEISNISIIANNIENEIHFDDYEIFLNIINKSRKTSNQNLSNSKTALIIYKLKNNKTLSYNIFINNKDNTINYYKNEKLYTLDNKLSKCLLLHKAFDFNYDKSCPSFDFECEKNVIEAMETNVNLIYKKVDGLEYKNNTSKIVENIKKTTINKESLLSIQCKENNIKLTVSDLENNIYFDDLVNLNSIYIPNNDGDYIYNFYVNWDNENYGTMSKSYKITVDNPVEFDFNKTELSQGDFITIKAYNVNDDEILFIENSFFDKFRFFKENSFYIGYLPISSRVIPKEYTLKYGVKDKYSENIKIKVNKRNFRIQNLYVKKSIMDTTSNNSAYEQYYKYFYPARDIVDENRNYSENFILPVKGKVTTEFGEYRYINDRVTSYSHSGIDIAVEKGTKIKATNSGYVTLSKNLDLTGNTIIIDHGQGLFSFYQHLDEVFVKTDQFVKQGEYIGTVGTTGRSTGPHLHFAISFHNKYIDPGYLIYNQPITKDNYIELFGK